MVRLWFALVLGLTWAMLPNPTEAGGIEAELKSLALRAAQADQKVGPLRLDLSRFRQRHPGTIQAVQAAGLLRDLPSPLDQLDAKNIPALERFDWHPKETVALLGDHRGRQGGPATAVAWSKNGKWLASGSTNGYIRIWDPAPMRLLHTLGHGSGVFSIAFSKDSTVIAHGGGDGQVILQDMTAMPPKTKETCKVASTPLMALALAPNMKWFVTGGSDARIYLWDLSANPPKELTGANAHPGGIHALGISAEGKTIASGGADKTLRLWALVNNRLQEKASLEAHAGALLSLAFHPLEEKTLVSGGDDGTIRVWHQAGGKLNPRTTIKTKGGAVHGLAFTPSGKTLAAACADGIVRTFTLAANGQLVEKSQLEGHIMAATGVVYSPDGTTLASCSSDWTVRQWPAVAGPRPKDKTIKGGHLSHIYALEFSPDEKGLATGSYDKTVRFWDLPAVEIKERLPVMKADGDVYSLAFAPDGKTLAAGGAGVNFRTFDPVTGRSEFSFTGHANQISRLAFAPDGQTIASSSLDKSVRFWNPRTAKSTGSLTTFESYVNAVAYAPDGKRFVVCSGYYLYDKAGRIVVKNSQTQFLDSTVRLYDDNFKELYRWKSTTILPGCATFSPDGKYFFAGAGDGMIRRWETAKPAQEPEIYYKTSESDVSVLACSPDGRWLASYGPDYRINLIDLATGKLKRHWSTGEQFGGLAWGTDSRHLAVGVGTGITLIFRLEEGKK